jgi:opacity protein-like surface antigen
MSIAVGFSRKEKEFAAHTRRSGQNQALKIAAYGAAAIALAVFSSSSALAQCTGLPAAATNTQPLTVFASTTASSLISTINTLNTAFLTQTTAFISAPPNPPPNSPGGGVWVRAVGGKVKTDSATTLNWSFGTAATSGVANCFNTTDTKYGGVQAGSDYARLNIDGWNIHLGTTVGYAESKNTTGSSEIVAQAPFAGTYAAATKGGFFVDGQIFATYYSFAATDPSVNINSQHSNARGVGFAGSIGYNFPLKDNWFIEPSAGFVWTRTEVDPIIAVPTIPFAAPASISVDNIQSKLGHAGLRVGTSFVSGNLALQPFAAASVWHEFAGDAGANVSTQCVASGLCFVAPGPEYTIAQSSSRVGTYGQYALGLAGAVLNTGWVGYIRGDYRKGSEIEGWGINGGIRYQFTPELVAAMTGKHPIYKAPPPPMPAPYNWTGFYVGVNGGITYGKSHYYFPGAGTAPSPDVRYSGGMLGGQAGYNYQMGHWVFGVEADADWTNALGASQCPNFIYTCEAKLKWLASGTGRVGYSFWSDRILTYVKGGFAAGSVEVSTVDLVPPPTTLPTAGTTATVYGWTVGFGTEVGLTKNWSAKGEYRYYQLSGHDYLVSGATVAHVQPKGSVALVGLNYRFP